VCDDPLMTIDLLPTVAGQVGAPLPPLPIDGRDAWRVISGTGPAPKRTYWFYYGQNQLQAVRSGKWKVILPHTAAVLEGRGGGRDGLPSGYSQVKTELALYDLETDPGETRNRTADQPAILKQMLAEVEAARVELGDSLTQREGRGNRAPGRVEP
jgi:arylsulfatase